MRLDDNLTCPQNSQSRLDLQGEGLRHESKFQENRGAKSLNILPEEHQSPEPWQSTSMARSVHYRFLWNR
jgi:hypothetical protein